MDDSVPFLEIGLFGDLVYSAICEVNEPFPICISSSDAVAAAAAAAGLIDPLH